MPIISIDIARLPREQKISLIEKLTATAVEVTNIPAHAFTIVIHELDDGNIGVGGKTLDQVRKPAS